MNKGTTFIVKCGREALGSKAEKKLSLALGSMVSRGWKRGSQIQRAEKEVDCEQMKKASADSTRSLASTKDIFQGFSVSPNSQTASNFPHDFLLQPHESPRTHDLHSCG